MFGRKDSSADLADPAVTSAEDATTPAVAHGQTAPKGRPTPKRRDQEAARRTPLVPADRDAAKRDAKARAKEERHQRREAMARGDEKALPPRDRGPIKRYIRNAVDARISIGEVLLPLMLIVLAVSLIPNRTVQFAMLIAVWAVIVIGIVDSALLWQRIKKQIQLRFHEAPPRGSASYAIMRSFQLRLTRMPRPTVKRGDKI